MVLFGGSVLFYYRSRAQVKNRKLLSDFIIVLFELFVLKNTYH